MIALPLASEDWNVFPELIYRPRKKKQFLEKIAFYFSKKGNPAMNKITFKGRRVPQEILFVP